MTTTPSDLLAAAERITGVSWLDERRELADDLLRAIYTLAEHVKATVHPDDDEPVTAEWLLQNGFVDRTTSSGNRYHVWLDDRPVMMLGMDTKYRWYLNGGRVDDFNPTRGQVRQLLKALNVEGK